MFGDILIYGYVIICWDIYIDDAPILSPDIIDIISNMSEWKKIMYIHLLARNELLHCKIHIKDTCVENNCIIINKCIVIDLSKLSLARLHCKYWIVYVVVCAK